MKAPEPSNLSFPTSKKQREQKRPSCPPGNLLPYSIQGHPTASAPRAWGGVGAAPEGQGSETERGGRWGVWEGAALPVEPGRSPEPQDTNGGLRGGPDSGRARGLAAPLSLTPLVRGRLTLFSIKIAAS